MNDPNLSSFIWSVADLLRGDYKQSEYGKVILPFTVLRRLDCVLEPTKAAVLAEMEKREKARLNPEPFLLQKSGQLFYNTSPLDMKKLMGDQDNIAREPVRLHPGVLARRPRHLRVLRLPHPDRPAGQGRTCCIWSPRSSPTSTCTPRSSATTRWGTVFEELIRKFAELSNETAGEHFTPREVIRLMVNLLFIEDDDALTKPGVVRSLYDPTAGTGGMLSRGGRASGRHEPGRPAGDVRPGTQRRVLRHLQGRHAHQGAGHRQHHPRQHAVRRRPAGQAVRLHALQSAVRRRMEEDPEGNPQGSTSSRASTAASVPACRASAMARCCS